MKIKTLLCLTLLTGITNPSWAFQQCRVHTWHDVSSQSGNWNITLKMISQDGILVDKACQPIHNQRLTVDAPLVYGFGFSDNATFDIAYTLTAISEEAAFESKTCVFVITAKGPANPDIHPISYHGAKCEWQVVPGVGENFSVG